MVSFPPDAIHNGTIAEENLTRAEVFKKDYKHPDNSTLCSRNPSNQVCWSLPQILGRF
jgi:hypothetical protein